MPNIEITVSSEYSPGLAEGLARGKLDLAFMRPEPNRPISTTGHVVQEPLVVDHARATIASPRTTRWMCGNWPANYSSADRTSPARCAGQSRAYLAANGLDIEPAHRVHNLTMAMSLIASTRGVALLPAYAENFLPWSVTSRPLKGEPPTIDLVIGYNKTNTSPILGLFLSRVDQLKKRVPQTH